MNLARHYRTLGLHRGASSGEVKAAYRKLVRQYHPDINPDAAAIERFIVINDAYTALCGVLSVNSPESALGKGVVSARLENKLNTLRQRLERIGLGSFNGGEQVAQAAPFTQASGRASSKSTEPPIEQPVEPPIEQPTESWGSAIASEPTPLNERLDELTTAQLMTDEHWQSPTVQRPIPVQLSAQEESLKQEAYQQLKDLLKQQKFPRATALVEGLAHRMPSDTEIIQWQAIVYQRWGRQLIEEGQRAKARIYLNKALRTDPCNPSLWREINQDFWQLASLSAPSSNAPCNAPCNAQSTAPSSAAI
jgi:tetratricopeptide (TPR) repeat protein